MKKIIILLTLTLLIPSFIHTNECMAQTWPKVTQEMKPGSRWWWLGSAVTTNDLQWNIGEYASKGIGTLEITPLYGVQGNDKNNIPFLSRDWMEALRTCQMFGDQYDIQMDMNCGTGWPFGGPEVPIEEAACKLVCVDTLVSHFRLTEIDLSVRNPKDARFAELDTILVYPEGEMFRIIAVYTGRTGQKVKRAAPGGEGWVIDHFSKTAVKHYLERFDRAFTESGVPYPKVFFNDSYEVYNADWTPTFFEDFYRLRGYRLEDHMPELLGDVEDKDYKVLSDYRETLGDLLLSNFTEQWTAWAHSHGAKTRNQAHGSPANLIDNYAAVDIPEIEGFGLSEFGIKGLRVDSGKIRHNDSDYSMMKYAASAAHIMGKPITSSETFTWLTEHFRTSFAQCKPDLDLLFCAGVNHVFFHGTCYSPKDDPWPGWKFYASVDMSPTNPLWRDQQSFDDYITRCQSFLQMGKPDNDFLVFLPVRDMWARPKGKGTKGLLMQFSIHDMGKLAPDFIKSILDIDKAGYDCDYISEKYLMGVRVGKNGTLMTEAGTTYRALIIPGSGRMSDECRNHIETLKSQGATIIYGVEKKAMARVAKAEDIRTTYGMKMIRRSNDKGYHYFISNLTDKDVRNYVRLSVPFKDAYLYNPVTGEISRAEVTDGKIFLDLRSGESVIIRTYNEVQETNCLLSSRSTEEKASTLELTNTPWTFSFIESTPKVEGTLKLDTLKTWERLALPNADITMGTGVYETAFKSEGQKRGEHTIIDLGDVRETARVYVNGKYAGCAWCVPYELDITKFIVKGNNTLRIEVTNLPANRIADLDRKGVKWRKFNEINFVKLYYKEGDYTDWKPVASGLNSHVRIITYRNNEAQEVLEAAQRANAYFMRTCPDPKKPTFVKRERTSNLWTRGVYYEGLMALNSIAPQKSYIDYVDEWGNFHKWDVRNGVNTRNADDQCCAQTYLMRYEMTKDKKMISNVIANFDAQIRDDEADFDGQMKQKKYWWWIDAIQMAMPAMVHLSQITGDGKYTAEAEKLYMWIRNSEDGGLWNAKEGLWWRDADFNPPYKEEDGNNSYWSRGNGWVYAAYCRTIERLPEKSTLRRQLVKDYLAMTRAIARLQREDGFWNVSLASPTTFGGPETSGTSLFLYGLSWGIRTGIIPAKKYMPICQKVWDALKTVVHPNGFIGWLQGTGKEPKDGQPVTYTSRPDFEDYGTGCFLLGTTEYYKLLKEH